MFIRIEIIRLYVNDIDWFVGFREGDVCGFYIKDKDVSIGGKFESVSIF